MEALIFRAKGKGTITVCVGETSEEALERDDKKLEQIPTAACGFARRGQCHHFAGPCFQICLLECDKGAEITSLRFDVALWSVEHQMQFETDDDYVNNLLK